MTNDTTPLEPSYDVVIVGGGQAAVQVVSSLRMKRFEGSILITGDEPYVPYQRPPLSKAALKDGLEETALWFRPGAFFEKQGIALRTSLAATSINRDGKTVTLADGQVIGYGSLVLATGATVRNLPASVGLPDESTFVLRSFDDALALRPRLTEGANIAVIGAGYIGLEVAATARQLGGHVTVIDLAERAMQRTASTPISSYFEQLHRAKGVDLYFQDSVERAEDGVLHLASGASIPFDTVVVGIGVTPNQELAAHAGLICEDGIVTDLNGRTNDPSIYAAGDCARHAHTGFADTVRLESVQSAIDQGKVVADSIFGGSEEHSAVPWFWSDQYDTKLQVVGVATDECAALIKGDPQSGSFAVYHMRGGEPVSVEAVNAPQDFVAARKSVGTGRPLADDVVAALEPLPS